MKTRILFGAAAALAALTLAGAASADITVVPNPVANELYTTTSGTILDDFDNILNPNVSFSGHITSYENPIVDSAAPPYDGSDTGPAPTTICCDSSNDSFSADATNYSSVQADQTSTFSTNGAYYLTSFSFYIGSPDTYNTIVFTLTDGSTQEFDGTNIWGGTPPGDGNRDNGFRVYYDFNGAHVSSIAFSTGGSNAFESDGFAGTLAIPEPASWALMMLGFGGAGAALRRRRSALAIA
jgi:PEP-CTERM motif